MMTVIQTIQFPISYIIFGYTRDCRNISRHTDEARRYFITDAHSVGGEKTDIAIEKCSIAILISMFHFVIFCFTDCRRHCFHEVVICCRHLPYYNHRM